ncbi:MAG: methyltransferase, partial [Nanopusillaceae archaeon]
KDVSFADILPECIKLSKINFYINFIDKNANLDILYGKINEINFPVKFYLSDLFSNINEKFDVILFNPPYLPEIEHEEFRIRRWVSGGTHGYETIDRFLYEAVNYLNPFGDILLVLSSVTNPERIINKYSNIYYFRIIDKVHIFFEDLILLHLKRRF